MAHKRKPIAPAEDLASCFGQSRYESVLGGSSHLPIAGSKRDIRQKLRADCPDGPGVYGMADGEGRLIYTGMSRSLLRRLIGYFTASTKRKKEARIGRHARVLFWQPAAHELVAWLRERELIRRYRPNFNVQGHPTGMKLGYITLQSHAAGSFQLQPHIPKSHAGLWGPLPLTRWTKQGVNELNHHFGLRDCPRDTPMFFAGELPQVNLEVASPCIRADLGTCLAPCIAGCSRSAYDRVLKSARAFLDGAAPDVLQQMQSELKSAAAELKFEKCAKLRDRLEALKRIDLHLRRFHDWRHRANFVYPITSSLDGREWWLLVQRGTAQLMIPRPQTREEKQAASLLLQQQCEELKGSGSRASITGPDEFEGARLLLRWFRLNEAERERRFSLAQAKRLCRDRRRPASKPSQRKK